MTEPLLTLRDISLNYGGVRALAGLNLTVQPGSLHGLVGPNGAGKTTAMNVISGLATRSQGEMRFLGKPFHPIPHRLAQQGLARTFQAAAIIEELSALENVQLGGYSWTKAGIIASALKLPSALREERNLRERALSILSEIGFSASPDARVAEISAWQRRQVEIARALMTNPRLVLFDEPAAGLSSGEVASLKAMLLTLRDRNAGQTSILLIEHNVPFVFSLCDTVTAMALGRDIAHGTPTEVRHHPDVISSYLGGGGQARRAAATPAPFMRSAEKIVLELDNVASGYGPTTVLHGVSLVIQAGETVALFGPNGAGKSTLLNTIAGERVTTSGRVVWHGAAINGQPVQRIVERGIGLVPQGRAVIERQSVESNLLISTMGLSLNKRDRQQRLDEIFTQFPSLALRRQSLGASLSGGERQMLAIAKVLIRRPLLLLLDEPSIGLAPAVIDEVQRIVADLQGKGMTVLIAEQAVDWVLPVATRAYAIAAGRIVAEGAPHDLADVDALAERYLGETAAAPLNSR